MQDFKFVIERQNQITQVTIEGNLNEDCDLERYQLPTDEPVSFNLSRLKAINSTGIRKWILWQKKYEDAVWIFTECPHIFLNQLNSISNFIPKNSQIKSFLIPFFSEITSEQRNILLSRQEHFQAGKIANLPQILDSQGNPMELDVVPERFFKFLEVYK